MPTYVYRREDGTTFEISQRISEDALTTDPETGQAVERVIGAGAGVIFKGTGFYQTDYVRKSGGDEAKSETKPADAKPATTKTDTKSTAADD